MSSLVIIIERLRIARLLALLKDAGPYAAIELLLPGGSLLALGLWLYSRHKSGKPLLPERLRSTVRRLTGLDLLNRRLSTLQERSDGPLPLTRPYKYPPVASRASCRLCS